MPGWRFKICINLNHVIFKALCVCVCWGRGGGCACNGTPHIFVSITSVQLRIVWQLLK